MGYMNAKSGLRFSRLPENARANIRKIWNGHIANGRWFGGKRYP